MNKIFYTLLLIFNTIIYSNANAQKISNKVLSKFSHSLAINIYNDVLSKMAFPEDLQVNLALLYTTRDSLIFKQLSNPTPSINYNRYSDSLLYSQFLSLYPIGSTMDPITHSFDTLTNIGMDFEKVRVDLFNNGLSDDDALTQAMAFIMSKYNTGLVLFRKKLHENKFTKINTKEIINAAGNKTYSPYNCL